MQPAPKRLVRGPRWPVFLFIGCTLFCSARLGEIRGAEISAAASGLSASQILYDPFGIGQGSDNFVTGILSASEIQGQFDGTDINAILGAETFYQHGYSGTRAVIANIEGGHAWISHETLEHTQQILNHSLALNEIHRHSTWVGMILAGREGQVDPGDYQRGMAPAAQLYSGAFAAQWLGMRYTGDFYYFYDALWDQYRRAFSSGVNFSGRRADVINSSVSLAESTDGMGPLAVGLDGLANANPRTLFVSAAGNAGGGSDRIVAPGIGYNDLTVAALNTSFNSPSVFSSTGLSDYADPVNGSFNNVRQAVDIAAPGASLSSAYYGGETGGNGTTDNLLVFDPPPAGPPEGTPGGADFYSLDISGTSFSSAVVAGGAALLYDAAYAVFPADADARDARVMKAVLMNSAVKTNNWNNGQVAHPNDNGGVQTARALDNRVGAGRMNLAAAYYQFVTGTADVDGSTGGNFGLVQEIGWDFGQVASGVTNDYYFDAPLRGGTTFTATLSWFRNRRIDDVNTLFDESYDNLNLELWSVAGGNLALLISESNSLYNNSEHFSFVLPRTGNYALRVRWFGEVFDLVSDSNQEFYGLAWSGVAVPEPSLVILLTTALPVIGGIRRGSQRMKKPA